MHSDDAGGDAGLDDRTAVRGGWTARIDADGQTVYEHTTGIVTRDADVVERSRRGHRQQRGGAGVLEAVAGGGG